MFCVCGSQGLRGNSQNKCKLLDLSNDEVIVAEGRWETQEPTALVNGIPIGPKAVKVFVDSVIQPETFIWRPTFEMTYIEDCLMAFVSWPFSKVVFETASEAKSADTAAKAASEAKSAATVSKDASEAKSLATASKSKATASKSKATSDDESHDNDATCQSSPVKNTLPSQSPLRKSPVSVFIWYEVVFCAVL